MLQSCLVSIESPARSKLALRRGRSGRRGSTLVLIAVLLPAALAIAAYTINVCYMELARTELQNHDGCGYTSRRKNVAVTGDRGEAIVAAERLMAANPFANQSMSLSGSDVIFGVSTRRSRRSDIALHRPNSIPTR